jgi:hypothetical protein
MANSSAMVFLSGLLGLLEFLEFIASPVGLAAISGIMLGWALQLLCHWSSAIAMTVSASFSLQIYRHLTRP